MPTPSGLDPRAGRWRLPGSVRLCLWSAIGMDTAVVAWMLGTGDQLERGSRVGAVATLGGHHLVVLVLALLALALLAVLAVLTLGFAAATRGQSAILAAAAVMSLVAVSGALSVVALVVLIVFLSAILGWAFR